MRSPCKLVVSALLVFAFTAAPSAFALPPQCEFSCTCNSRCGQVCAIGNWVVTCDFDQVCRDYCFASAPAKTEPVPLTAPTESCDRPATSPDLTTIPFVPPALPAHLQVEALAGSSPETE